MHTSFGPLLQRGERLRVPTSSLVSESGDQLKVWSPSPECHFPRSGQVLGVIVLMMLCGLVAVAVLDAWYGNEPAPGRTLSGEELSRLRQ
eukprot:1861208-Amphidinium_carterae.1